MSETPANPTDFTRILGDITAGRRGATDDLLSHVYGQLHAIARRRMAGERSGHTLQATALVNEAYLRLVGGAPVPWRDRAHFFFAAAEAMRRILVDHARARATLKRGGRGRKRVPLGVCDLAADHDPAEILALDEAISRLEELDERAAAVVRLRFLAGLSVEETAQVLGVSDRTVKAEWAYARAKLRRLLDESDRRRT